MVENMPIGALTDFLSTFVWSTIPNGLPIETGELLRYYLLAQMQIQIPQLPLLVPEITVPEAQQKMSPKSKKSSPSPMRCYELNRNTYSDCEKRHFLEVAYQNHWGTTVAANHFTRSWGKGPTRRMFYWWREQFKKEYDREQTILNDLKSRKSDLIEELTALTRDCKRLADRAQECAHQINAVDSEIAALVTKRQKAFCSITGEPCVHGDGLQEEGTVTEKLDPPPFRCDYCEMPFQREITCLLHMRMCQTRYLVPVEEPESVSCDPPKDTNVVQIYNNNNSSELAELAEYLIGRIAERAQV